jgi:hypothetical protein
MSASWWERALLLNVFTAMGKVSIINWNIKFAKLVKVDLNSKLY